MTGLLIYIVVGILFFGILIAVHEGGHFLAAKLLGVQVNEFAIGMGPALFSRQKGETQYSLRLFPIGGYCAMEGEDEESDNPRAFTNKAPWRKVIILVAGSFNNFVAGFLLVVLLFAGVGAYSTPVIDSFMEGFPCAGEEGLLPGDRILSVNGHRIFVTSDVSTYLALREDGADLVIRRDGQKLERQDLPLTLREYEDNGETVTKYGLYFTREEMTFSGLVRESWNTSLYFARLVWSSLGMLVSGQVGLNDMSGPVGIVSYMGEAGSQGGSVAAGLQNVIYFVALIAINLAIMNLLPLPALDGGRVLVLVLNELWYLCTRRTIPQNFEAYYHAGGFVLLILLMIVITFNDVWKLIF